MQAELTKIRDTSAFLSKNLLHFLCAKTSTNSRFEQNSREQVKLAFVIIQ